MLKSGTCMVCYCLVSSMVSRFHRRPAFGFSLTNGMDRDSEFTVNAPKAFKFGLRVTITVNV